MRLATWVQTVLAKVDRDMPIGLDFTEFLLAISLISSVDPRRKTELLFCMYDADGNSSIEVYLRRIRETISCDTGSSCLLLIVDLRFTEHRYG